MSAGIEYVRWYVTTPDGELSDVGAASMSIHPSGALVFLDPDGYTLLAFAPHAWVTVTE